jgi:hypothetical protein
MKRIITAFGILFLSLSLSAQYKKASVFGKVGRTYEVGTQVYAMGDGKGSPLGYKLGFGIDVDGKRLFGGWEVQFIPSYKFAYTTQDYNSTPVSVSGTTKATWIYQIGWSYHLLKNDADKAHTVQPFVSAGIGATLSGGLKTQTTSPDTYDVEKQTAEQTFNTGINGGLGCLVNFSPKFALKLQGGYNYVINFGTFADNANSYYHLFSSHPFVSLGIRFRLITEQ